MKNETTKTPIANLSERDQIIELLKKLPRSEKEGALFMIYDSDNINVYTNSNNTALFMSMYSLFKQGGEFAKTIMGACMQFVKDTMPKQAPKNGTLIKMAFNGQHLKGK